MFKKTVNIALLSTTFLLLLFILTGCSSILSDPEFNNEAYQITTGLSDEPPLTEEDMRLAVPDFLTEEQQLLYRRAHSLYQHMFDGETTGIDDAFPAAGGQTEYDEYTPDGSDYTYICSHSRWQSWADFDRVIHALFTDTFWSACNDDGNAPIYIEHDGRLFILDCAYGDQYYNSNIPDEFTLTARTDDRIDFTVTAHYSYPYPRWDETDDERDKRLETSYEYTRTYPVTLIYTDAGWRFDAFTTPNQADMQCLGEWDGISEDDFYAEHVVNQQNTSAPEFLKDVGKPLSALKSAHPEGECVVCLDGFPDSAAACFGEVGAEYLYYFFGTQSGDAEKAMNECEDRLQCAGFVTTASVLFPDMEADLPFEDFFSLIGVNGYEYFSGEDVITAQGWLRFTYHGMEVMVNTNEATTGGGWKFTGDKIVKRTAPVSIVDLGILNTDQDLAEPVMFDRTVP